MPRRVTLTDRQREALLHLPVDQGELLRHYTLSDEDLGCGSAWKRDPGSGVIGVEKGPLIPVV